jgi:hypothetical protein
MNSLDSAGDGSMRTPPIWRRRHLWCSRYFPRGSPPLRRRNWGVTVTATQVRSNGAHPAKLARLLDAGAIRAAIDSTYPLAEARLRNRHYDFALSKHFRADSMFAMFS